MNQLQDFFLKNDHSSPCSVHEFTSTFEMRPLEAPQPQGNYPLPNKVEIAILSKMRQYMTK